MQQLLEAKTEENSGSQRYERISENSENQEINYRNGHSKKSVRSSFRDVELKIPRDRD